MILWLRILNRNWNMDHLGEIEKRLWSVADRLYDDRTGLPVETYSESDLHEKTEQLFDFFSGSGMTGIDQK